MYQILDFAKLPHISHIIWDIDGTITDESGKLSQEVAGKIINLALKGVYHSFITGRDAAWIIKNVIDQVRRFINFPRVNNNLIFFAEVGCVKVDVDSAGRTAKHVIDDVKEHPLVTNAAIRNQLKQLSYDPGALRLYEGGRVDADHRVIHDAGTGDDQRGYLVDIRGETQVPKLHPYIWSQYKEAFATFEVIRDENGKVKTFDQAPFVDIVRRVLKEGGLETTVDVEEVSTAINVVPLVEGVKLGKSWAAGKALEFIRDVKLGREYALDTVMQMTIAVGDGKADFDFTRPAFSRADSERLLRKSLPIIFVGPTVAMPSDRALSDNMIIQATGQGDLAYDGSKDVIVLQRAMGARVVSAVLDFLNAWGYFAPFH